MKDSARGTTVMAGLMAVTAAAMLLPAALGFTLREHDSARAFLYSASLLGSLAGLIYLARRNLRRKPGALSHPFYILTASYLLIPLFMALPVTEAAPGPAAVRCLVRDGRRLYHHRRQRAGPGYAAQPAGLARAGGMAGRVVRAGVCAALLAPMNMGGFDLVTARSQTMSALPDWSRKMRATQIGQMRARPIWVACGGTSG